MLSTSGVTSIAQTTRSRKNVGTSGTANLTLQPVRGNVLSICLGAADRISGAHTSVCRRVLRTARRPETIDRARDVDHAAAQLHDPSD